MTNKTASHSPSQLLSSALDLYRSAVGLAHTEVRILNDHLRLHALRMLEHVSTSVSAAPPRSRTRSLRFAQLSLPKLRATVEAAWCERLVSDEQRSGVLSQIHALEDQITTALAPATSARDPSKTTNEAEIGPEDPVLTPEDRVLTPDEAADLAPLREPTASAQSTVEEEDASLRWSG